MSLIREHIRLDEEMGVSPDVIGRDLVDSCDLELEQEIAALDREGTVVDAREGSFHQTSLVVHHIEVAC